jgi:polyferredoxin
MSPIVYRLLADFVVAIHFAYVAFVLVGAILVLVGALRHWAWVRNFWFRAIHLLMIGVVVGESFCNVLCPLTDWEDQLRELAGETVASGTFIGRLAHWLLFYDIPHSTLVVSYYLFGLAVLLTWLLVPPRWPWKRRNN